MSETSASLLDRLRGAPDGPAWQQLVAIYTPLISGWLRQRGLARQDSEDLSQEVMLVVVRRVPEFERERLGAFRSWLRNITVRCLSDYWRKQKRQPQGRGFCDLEQALEQLADPDSGLSREWDAEHDRHVMHQLLALIQGEFSETTWTAFRRVALDNDSPRDVAEQLGITENAVFIAKSRVLARLRREGARLLD